MMPECGKKNRIDEKKSYFFVQFWIFSAKLFKSYSISQVARNFLEKGFEIKVLSTFRKKRFDICFLLPCFFRELSIPAL